MSTCDGCLALRKRIEDQTNHYAEMKAMYQSVKDEWSVVRDVSRELNKAVNKSLRFFHNIMDVTQPSSAAFIVAEQGIKELCEDLSRESSD